MKTLAMLTLLALLVGAPAVAQDHASAAAGPEANADLLVSAEWLAERAGAEALVVLHVGRDEAAYRAGHIPGARFLPLASIVAERDGIPNQLPPVEALRSAFEAAGVSEADHVVLYGDLAGLAATRAFFSLEYLGHERVSLLDGGFEAWTAEGRPLATGAAPAARGSLTPRPQPRRVVDADWVHERLDDARYVLLDARPVAEYTGEEPGGGIPRPGHIPGAANLFWRTTYRSADDLRFRSPAELREMLTAVGVTADRTVVAYCRTGMQASHAYFVARYLGYDVRLFDGSFIEWSNRADLPVAR